jgi:uncharacterized membrane protein
MNENIYEKGTQGLIIGIMTSWFFYVINSNKFNTIQKTILCITTPFLPLSLILAIIFYFSNKSNVFKNEQEKTIIKKSQKEEALKDLYNKGILSKEEFELKSDKLNKDNIEEIIKFSAEFKNLKKLFDSKILTEKEFTEKTELLKLKQIERAYRKENNNEENVNAAKPICEIQTNRGIIKIELLFDGASPAINNKVYQNDLPAIDGKYRLGFMHNLLVKNGKIVDIIA